VISYIVAAILPGLLVALIARFSLNIWVGLIASLGIMMAVFDGAYRPLPVIITGVVSGLIGLWFGYKWIKNKSLTK
jgi:general stress protein CsbA